MAKPFVYTNLWVSAAVFAATWFTCEIAGVSINYAIFNVGGVLIVYGFARRFKGPAVDAADESEATQWHKSFPWSVSLTMMLGLALVVYGALMLPVEAMYGYALAAIPSFLYPVTFISKGEMRSLRSVPGLKLIIISCIWGYTIGIVPQMGLENIRWSLFWDRLFFTAALTIPFDVRDHNVDHPNLKTVPVLLGDYNALWFANALLWLSYAIQTMLLKGPVFELTITYVIIAAFILLSYPKRRDFHYVFWLEGAPWLILAAWNLL